MTAGLVSDAGIGPEPSPAERADLDGLLALLLEPGTRPAAFTEITRRGYLAFRVADFCCGDEPDAPLCLYLSQLRGHLVEHDSPAKVEMLGRAHSPINVVWYDREEHPKAWGPGLAGGR